MQNIVIGRYGPNEGSLVPLGDEEARLIEERAGEYGIHEMRDGQYFIDGRHVANVRCDWQGWIDGGSWIAFVRADGIPIVHLNRDPETGAVLDLMTNPDGAAAERVNAE